MAKPTSGREVRLECIKVAANIVIQLKDPKISVVGLADKFMRFIDGESVVGEPTGDVEFGTYDTKDVRKSFVRASQ